MTRTESSVRRCSLFVALLASMLLASCASTPKVSEPALRKQAHEAEADGARRYARGDYAGAVRSFGAASQLQQSFDDTAAAAQNSLNQARAELAQGKPGPALDRARRITHPQLALESLLLQAQAHLALGQISAAKESLTTATQACPTNCRLAPSLNLLQARAALADQRSSEALAHAEFALTLLQDTDEVTETGNAWRLIAAARLAGGDAAGALPAAHAALEIDRQLALPEKIARDWLLIGDIHRKVGAGDTAAAYRRALDVANAARLAEVARLATQALAEVNPAGETAR